jgi:hypothetical protein
MKGGSVDVERVLVCVIASTRAHQLTFSYFKRQVIDELGGDLALALLIDENYDYANPFWQHAKYRWTAPNYVDFGEAFDFAQRWLCQQRNIARPDWRLMLGIKGYWQGGILSPDPQPTASAIMQFCRWLLLHGMQQDQILDRYDRFVITRSDFVWHCPHPPLSILDPTAIWVPEGEDHQGLNDRHLVISRADIVKGLNMIEDVLLHPTELYEEMKHQPTWNDEQFLAHHFLREGLLSKVKRFPYVMHTGRPLHDKTPTWSPGRFEPAVGHFVKYADEFRLATAYATVIRSRADWEDGEWKKFNPRSAVFPPMPFLRKIYYQMLWLLRPPQRVSRLVRFGKRLLGRT